jgi:2-(1,2-epoxy-1,2-dihydrophenyl)acetyl-CoA isomerase
MGGYTSAPGVDIELDGTVLRIRLDRPEKRNAIDDVMMAALIDAVDAAGRDEAVRVIVFSGEGGNFCGGADIVARNAAPASSGSAARARPRAGSIQRRLPSQAHRLIPLVSSVQTPVVCAVRGWAAGIGLALALAADMTIAAEDARFWAPFSERGFTPDSGVTWLLPRRIGEVRARRMLLLGTVVGGAEAERWGLIERAVPADDLDGAVSEMVDRFAGAATVSVGLTKWLLHSGASSSLDEALRNEGFAMELSSRSEDFREGLAAFRDKRPTHFEGR